MSPGSHTASSVSDTLNSLLPAWDQGDCTMALVVYKALMRGRPVNPTELAQLACVDVEAVRDWQHRIGDVDVNLRGDIEAFRGITTVPTSYKVHSAAGIAYGWCAFDTLFISELCGQPVRIEFRCAASGRPMTLNIDGCNNLNPDFDDWVMSLRLPDTGKYSTELRRSFCAHSHFYYTAANGSQVPSCSVLDGAMTLCGPDALALAIERNRTLFSAIWPKREIN